MPLFLTERDRQLIQGLLDQARRDRVNVPSRPATERTWTEGEDHQAPEVYVAWPRSPSGIPGLTVVGTAGPGGNDQPGKADCDIYKIVPGTPPELGAVADVERTVYNLSEAAIPQTWILVARTKFGRWVALVIPGVYFGKLEEPLFRGGSATMSVWEGDPLASTGTDGFITVYDWFLEVGDSLPTGTKCKAELYGGKFYVTTAECS